MKFRVVVKDRETGEVLFDQVIEAVNAEHAKKQMLCHIEAWKLEREKYFDITIEQVRN
jgi:hypothetical protein